MWTGPFIPGREKRGWETTTVNTEQKDSPAQSRVSAPQPRATNALIARENSGEEKTCQGEGMRAGEMEGMSKRGTELAGGREREMGHAFTVCTYHHNMNKIWRCQSCLYYTSSLPVPLPRLLSPSIHRLPIWYYNSSMSSFRPRFSPSPEQSGHRWHTARLPNQSPLRERGRETRGEGEE